MKTSSYYLALFMLIVFTATPNISFSQKDQVKEKEKTEITYTRAAFPDSMAFAIPAPAWGALFSIGNTGIQAYLKARKKKFIADFSQASAIDDFYQINSDKFEYTGIGLRRLAKFSKDGGKDTLQEAFDVAFQIIHSRDSTAFRFHPYSLKVTAAKAKVKKNLDLVINIEIISSWLDKDGKPHKQVLGSNQFLIKNVKIGKRYDSKGLTETFGGEWIPYAPKSSHKAVGRGNCLVKISVREKGRATKNNKEIVEFLASSKDATASLVEAILDKGE